MDITILLQNYAEYLQGNWMLAVGAFVVIIVWMMSGCMASTIAELRYHNPVVHMILGLLIPYLYPAAIFFTMPVRRSKKQEAAAAAAEHAEGAPPPAQKLPPSKQGDDNELGLLAEESDEPVWNRQRLKELSTDIEGNYRGPFLILMKDGHEQRAEKILDAMEVSLVIEIVDHKDDVQRLRLPYDQMEIVRSCEGFSVLSADESAIDDWTERLALFAELAPPPRWRAGRVADAAMHAHYERFLPVAEYRACLRRRLLSIMPEASWLPLVLADVGSWRSVVDFWRLLPSRWHGRLTWEGEDDWYAVACALAAPARFGTERDRYPEQLARLRETSLPAGALVLDLACGTGQWSWQVAELLDESVLVAGATLEPLEAWMAASRRLPHLDDAGASQFPQGELASTPVFWAGDVRHLRLRRRANLIFCNGLAGGPAMRRDEELMALWQSLDALADGDCEVWMANSFHDGFGDASRRCRELAPASWEWEEVGRTSLFRRA